MALELGQIAVRDESRGTFADALARVFREVDEYPMVELTLDYWCEGNYREVLSCSPITLVALFNDLVCWERLSADNISGRVFSIRHGLSVQWPWLAEGTTIHAIAQMFGRREFTTEEIIRTVRTWEVSRS